MRSGDKIIVATGTSFLVERLSTGVNVVLFEGSVSVLDAQEFRSVDSAPERVMKPGTRLFLASSGTASVSMADPGRDLSWEGGQLSFDDEPLAAAVERINRYASVPIRIGDFEARRTRVSGVFNAADTQSFIEGVTGVFPLRSVTKNGSVTIFSDVVR